MKLEFSRLQNGAYLEQIFLFAMIEMHMLYLLNM